MRVQKKTYQINYLWSLDEDADNVKMTLAFMKANRLIEQLAEDEYLLTKVPETIGSETTAAERMRRMRDKEV